MKFREIYCNNCNKMLGKYNVKYYSEDKVGELVQTIHILHTRAGHHIEITIKES